MTGQLLYGVTVVNVLDGEKVVPLKSDGRAYLWSNGAVTVYSGDQSENWTIIPPWRVWEILGGEHG